MQQKQCREEKSQLQMPALLKGQRSQIINPILYLKELEKEQIKLKASKKKETIKIK